MDVFISEDCLMRESYLHTHTHAAPDINSSPSISTDVPLPVNGEMWQVINGTVDQVYLSPFPVTADSGILVKFPVARQLRNIQMDGMLRTQRVNQSISWLLLTAHFLCFVWTFSVLTLKLNHLVNNRHALFTTFLMRHSMKSKGVNKKKRMMAELNLAALVSGSWYCECWFAVYRHTWIDQSRR